MHIGRGRVSLWLGTLLLTVALAASLGQAAPVAPAVPSGAGAFAHVQQLAGVIGPRVAGTPAERQAADYLAERLRQYGYPVEFHSFQWPYFEARQTQVQVVGSGARSIAAQALFYSAPTPSGGREAEVVAAGLGRVEDFEGRRVAGAIVLVERGGITFREKTANAAARGAVGIIVYNNQQGTVAGTLGQRSEIPAVAISQEDGRQLLETAQRGGLRIHLLVDTLFETRTSVNVVATKRGTTRPNEIIVVGGHFDSVPRAPGANDNASGVAAALEAARVLAGVPLARTIQFVLFSGEEFGLYGSRAFATDRREGIVAMINLDMVGWGQRLMLGTSQGRDDATVNVAVQVAERQGIQVTRFRDGGSDHASFERLGVPTVFVHRGIDPCYHQPCDLPANLDPKNLEEAARLTVGLIQELSQLRAARPAHPVARS